MTTSTNKVIKTTSNSTNLIPSVVAVAAKQDLLVTQHASKAKSDTQAMIDRAMESFDARKIKHAAKGKIDFFNQKTGKFGLKVVETFKTTEELKSSTFVASKDQDFADLKNNFAAKGLRSYSYGQTKKVSYSKTLPIHEIRKEIRRNSKSTRNSNNTKGFISSNSAVVCGEKLAYEKSQKINSMLAAQARLENVVIDQTEKTPAKASKTSLSVSFASLVADAWKTEKKAKKETVDHAAKLANEFKATKAKAAELTKEQKEDLFFAKLRENADKAKDAGDNVTYERINSYLFHVGA